MGVRLRTATWERYVPDVGDLRERARQGAADVLVVELRAPTVAVWRAYQGALIRKALLRRQTDGLAPAISDADAVMDDDAEGALLAACVGRFEPAIEVEGGEPVADGAELWARRHALEREGAHTLLVDLLGAILSRARLDEGTVRALGLGSGWPVSAAQTAGTAETAGPGG